MNNQNGFLCCFEYFRFLRKEIRLMTKKQNRSFGFGKRALSVVLAILMLLSMLVVMLTATTLSAGAISYWFVSGSMNGWTTTPDSSNLINSGTGGSVTIPVSASGINFKMIAEENGKKWCGVSGSGDVTIANNTKTELLWDSGANMHLNLPANTTSVTFTLTVENKKNYVTATPNTSGGGGGGDTSRMTYSAPVNTSNNANTASNLFWANATYFDYLSDEELSNTQWLKPVQAGTKNFGGAIDEWYPFYRFNRDVVKAQADAQSNWSQPLYFGNFCDTNDAYKESAHHQGGTDSYGYREATNSYNVTRFSHIANNSDKSWDGNVPHVYDMYTSCQGLVNNSLDANGNLLLPNGQQAPYFNASESGPLSGHAKVVNSSFPFKVTDVPGKDYKKYTFNSKNATDNVYFTWATDGSATYPTGVNYGAGKTYGVQDGLSRFMNNTASGYGIFPFNNASNNYKGTKTNANENLNYGFGIKTQMKFRVPAPDESAGVNTSTDPIYFEFTGDDDLWMYITDDQGNSQLVLDMGGAHKESHGKVNFNNLTATVDKVGSTGNSATKSFTFDYNKTYTMTVFYMERGLIESNCKMEFTMTPLGNNFIVTEAIDAANVNSGLQDVVTQMSQFGFRTYNNGTQISDNFYKDFKLSDGGVFDIPNSALPINSKPSIIQYAPTNSYLKYATSWSYNDNVSGDHLSDNSGSTDYTDRASGATTTTDSHTLINESGNEYDYAEMQVDFVNTPVVTDVSITKVVDDDTDHSSETFPATVKVQVASDLAASTYDLDIIDDGVAKTATGGQVGLRAGKTIVIPNVPVGARVSVQESANENYTVRYSSSSITVGTTNLITVTNIPNNPDEITGQVEGTKTLDNNRYTGTMFRFMVEGIAPLPGETGVVDTSSVQPDVDTGAYVTDEVNNGKFTITGLKFDQPGIYRYHAYEDLSKLQEIDLSGSTFYHSDIFKTSSDYIVVFNVTKENRGGKMVLVASDPYYIPYSPNGTYVASDFDISKAEGNAMHFTNNTMKGNVTVNKTDTSNQALDGVTFSIYAVDQAFLNSLQGKTTEQQYDLIKAQTPLQTAITGQGTFATGTVQFLNLPIYESGYNKSSAPSYQNYVIIETDGPSGYGLNKAVMQLKFPTADNDGSPHYDLTFDYVNGILKNPSTAGPGMMLFKILGIALATLSLIGLGGYMLYNKKRKVGKHFISE